MNASPHVIVSVNSGGGSGEVLARTDPPVIYQWIEMEIQTHGGGCDSTAADGGDDAEAASDGAAADAATPDAGAHGMTATDAAVQVAVEAGAATASDIDAASPADTDGGTPSSNEAGGSNAEAPTGSLTYTTPAGSCSCLVGAPANSSSRLVLFGCAALAVVAQRRKPRRRG